MEKTSRARSWTTACVFLHALCSDLHLVPPVPALSGHTLGADLHLTPSVPAIGQFFSDLHRVPSVPAFWDGAVLKCDSDSRISRYLSRLDHRKALAS